MAVHSNKTRYYPGKQAGLSLSQELTIQKELEAAVPEIFGPGFYFPRHSLDGLKYFYDRDNDIILVRATFLKDTVVVFHELQYLTAIDFSALEGLDLADLVPDEVQPQVIEPKEVEVFTWGEGYSTEQTLPFPVTAPSKEDMDRAVDRLDEVAQVATRAFDSVLQFRRYAKFLDGFVSRDFAIARVFLRTHFGQDKEVREELDRVLAENDQHRGRRFVHDPEGPEEDLLGWEVNKLVRMIDCKAPDARERLKALHDMYKRKDNVRRKEFKRTYHGKSGKISAFRRFFPDGDPLEGYQLLVDPDDIIVNDEDYGG